MLSVAVEYFRCVYLVTEENVTFEHGVSDFRRFLEHHPFYFSLLFTQLPDMSLECFERTEIKLSRWLREKRHKTWMSHTMERNVQSCRVFEMKFSGLTCRAWSGVGSEGGRVDHGLMMFLTASRAIKPCSVTLSYSLLRPTFLRNWNLAKKLYWEASKPVPVSARRSSCLFCFCFHRPTLFVRSRRHQCWCLVMIHSKKSQTYCEYKWEPSFVGISRRSEMCLIALCVFPFLFSSFPHFHRSDVSHETRNRNQTRWMSQKHTESALGIDNFTANLFKLPKWRAQNNDTIMC